MLSDKEVLAKAQDIRSAVGGYYSALQTVAAWDNVPDSEEKQKIVNGYMKIASGRLRELRRLINQCQLSYICHKCGEEKRVLPITTTNQGG